jgi:ubiquinone/menaquinone biosynthesis C-methylase UbiE
MSKLNPEDWGKFWKEGPITTFGVGFQNNYDGEFHNFWQQQLAGQTGEIIDLCCGNGALVWLSNELLNHPTHTANITGLDIARVTPFKTLKKKPADYPGVKFIGNTSIEALPLEDQSIDMAISQFGLEYAALDKTIPELGRALKPCAKLAVIVHFDDSALLVDSRQSLDKFEYLLAEGGFASTAIALDKFLLQQGSFQKAATQPQYAQLVGKMNRANAHVQTMPQATETSTVMVNSYIRYIYQVFDPKRAIQNRGQLIADWIKTLQASMGRTKDMKSAALSTLQLQELKSLVEAQGFSIRSYEPIQYKGNGAYGMALVATRTDS